MDRNRSSNTAARVTVPCTRHRHRLLLSTLSPRPSLPVASARRLLCLLLRPQRRPSHPPLRFPSRIRHRRSQVEPRIHRRALLSRLTCSQLAIHNRIMVIRIPTLPTHTLQTEIPNNTLPETPTTPLTQQTAIASHSNSSTTLLASLSSKITVNLSPPLLLRRPPTRPSYPPVSVLESRCPRQLPTVIPINHSPVSLPNSVLEGSETPDRYSRPLCLRGAILLHTRRQVPATGPILPTRILP